jgi:hypothetical protein
MSESVAVVKEVDAKKVFSPTMSDKSVHRVRDEPERQLGSLSGVIDSIKSDGGTPSADSIATQLSSMHTAQRAPVLLGLQQTHGNRYVQRVVAGIQTKLKVGQPGDIYEQEADWVADVVMRTAKPAVQRQPEEEEEKEEEEIIQPKLKTDTEQSIQRQEEEEEEESVQTKAPNRSLYVDPSLQKQLAQSRGGGSSLPKHSRAFMESRFGTDFGDVRVHTDNRATGMAKTLNAQAFTGGRDIYFGAGRYSPGTAIGDRLLAHELTHVVQQGSLSKTQGLSRSLSRLRLNTEKNDRIYRQTAASTGTESKTAAKSAEDIAPGVVELKGMSKFDPKEGPIAKYFEDKKTGYMKVRFGKIAEGTIKVNKKRGKYSIKKEHIDLTHPIFSQIGEGAAGFKPSLILFTKGDQIGGYIGVGEKGGSKAFVSQIRKAPDLIGLAGFDLAKGATIINKIETGNLHFGLKGATVTLGGVFSGKITLEAINEDITFAGNANIKAKGLVSGDLELNHSKEGLITGKAEVGLQLPKNFSGNLIVIWDGQMVTGEGKVGYEGDKFSGAIILKLMEKSQAEQLEEGAKAPAGEVALPGPKKPKSRKGRADYVVFGEGDLTFAFTEWLAGTAHVIVGPKGYITVIGEITPQKEIELFPQKDYNKKLFKVEARASYGIPVVGNIFIFANVGMDAFANIGPGKLYKMSVKGTYSTDPKKKQNFTIQGSLNISAAAGMRLRGEAGAGLEILAHDIKAGAGINGIAGIRGYAEATPVIGYREKAKEGEDKKGEFFIRGDLEIAAQPFLGLSGDVFVEIDAPWWSPVPDKRWTWPLVNKEWPIGGSLGMNASVEYVFGSKEPPAVEIKPAEFSADKFLTDLYSDKAKAKSGGAEAKKGTWAEKNAKGTEPPKGGKKGGAQVGEAPKLPPAQPRVKPGGAKKAKKQVDPNARTAEGKSVKEYQEEATKKGEKQKGKEPKKGAGKEEVAEKGKDGAEAAMSDFRIQEPFSMSGARHKLTARVEKGKFKVVAASNPEEFESALLDAIKDVERSSRSDKDKKYYISVINMVLKSVRELKYEVKVKENEILKGVKRDIKSEQQAVNQYVKRQMADFANQLQSVAATAGIKSLDDFYAAPPSERYIPDYPNQTDVGRFIRKNLYDRLGWTRVRGQFVSKERSGLITQVKTVQKSGNQNDWQQLKNRGLVEPNASIDNYDPEKVKYHVDHIEPIAARWNKEGRDGDDAAREHEMSEQSNLRLVTAAFNLKKGSGGIIYTPHVGSNFVSTYAEGGIKGALKIHGKPFLDANGKPLR